MSRGIESLVDLLVGGLRPGRGPGGRGRPEIQVELTPRARGLDRELDPAAPKPHEVVPLRLACRALPFRVSEDAAGEQPANRQYGHPQKEKNAEEVNDRDGKQQRSDDDADQEPDARDPETPEKGQVGDLDLSTATTTTI